MLIVALHVLTCLRTYITVGHNITFHTPSNSGFTIGKDKRDDNKRGS